MSTHFPSNIQASSCPSFIREELSGNTPTRNSIEKKDSSTTTFAKNLFVSLRDFFQEISKIFYGEEQPRLIWSSDSSENALTDEIIIIEDFKDSWATRCCRFIQSFNLFGASEAVQHVDDSDRIGSDIAPTSSFAEKAKNFLRHWKV